MTGFDKDEVFRERIQFARVYATSQDFGLHSRADYMYVIGDKGSKTTKMKWHAFKNTGAGANKIKCKRTPLLSVLSRSNQAWDFTDMPQRMAIVTAT